MHPQDPLPFYTLDGTLLPPLMPPGPPRAREVNSRALAFASTLPTAGCGGPSGPPTTLRR